MKILFIGDIVGKPGRDAVKRLVCRLKEEFGLDFVIANAENSSGGSGITNKTAEELFSSQVDVLTSGDHIWKKREIVELITAEKRILRPANYPAASPGAGWGVFETAAGKKVGVICVLGRVFLESVDCPFRACDQAIEVIKKETNIIIVDIHAEATSEKVALGWYLTGRVSAVLGTHTHIQTADEKILPPGTAYITDAGMTGPYDSVIGRRIEDVLQRFITSMPVKFEVAEDNIQLHGVVLDIDDNSGRARSIERIQRKMPAF
jgi:2',3'-cyclic-nucleotide 2'-phosphodiesterase